MRHRVAVEAEYDYVQPGTLTVPEEPAFFFCEIPEAWIAESARLQERLFAVAVADLRTICTEIDAWQRANRPEAADVDIRLRAVQVTVLTHTKTEAMPWLFLKNPLRYYGRCLVVQSEDQFSVIERDDFGKRALGDIPLMRAALPPMTPLPKDELTVQDIFGQAFLFYGDRLVTQKNENQPGTDYFGLDTYIYRFSLYRLNAQELVTVKEHGVWNEYASDNRLESIYIVSRDNGGTWDIDSAFDGSLLNRQSPVWPLP